MKSDKNTSNVPTLRFEKYTDFWQVNSFDNTFEFLSNNTLSRAELNYDTGVYKNIHYGDVLIKFSAFTNVEGNDVPFVNNSITNKTFIGQLLKNGDIVIADTAEDYTVGKATEIENAEKQYVVSGLHTIPCRPKFYFSSRFLGYYINSPSFHNQLIPYIQGVKVSSISKAHIKNTLIYFPKLDEQEKIACFLSLIDARIETQNKIIKDLKILKKELNTYLISGVVGNKKANYLISDVIAYEQPTKYIVTSEQYIDDGCIPVLTANKAFILGYTNETSGVYDKGDCIIFDDFTLDFKYVGFPFKVKSSAIKILTAMKNIDIRYFYEYLMFLNLSTNEHKRHYISEIASLPIYIPSMEEQQAILKVLASLSAKISNEENILNNLEKQRKYLLNALFI